MCIRDSRKDIQDILRDTGLGKTGYSIIGQGSITEIIAAKSTERRFLFEEAAGIAKFKYKKEESERRLAKTEENIIRLKDILTELESRLGPLKEQAEKAKKYLELRDEKKELELSIWAINIEKLDKKLEEAAGKAEIFKSDKIKTEAELSDIEKKIIECTCLLYTSRCV